MKVDKLPVIRRCRLSLMISDEIRARLDAAVSDDALSRDAGEAWWDAVRELDARGRFYASVNGVICAGTVR